MPCYLFTYHAYGSWLPDHPRGFVIRGQGIQPPNPRLAAQYAQNLKHRAIDCDEPVQRVLIDSMLEASARQEARCHYIATASTHAHVLLSWTTPRPWETVRKQLRYNATQRLNREFTRQEWFAKSPSRRQVRRQSHFDYLITVYLPRHNGLKWCESR